MHTRTSWSFIALFVIMLLVSACTDDTQMQEEPAPADTALLEPDTTVVDTTLDATEPSQ